MFRALNDSQSWIIFGGARSDLAESASAPSSSRRFWSDRRIGDGGCCGHAAAGMQSRYATLQA
jgi:hypothetical protein